MNPVLLYERIFTAAQITADQEASGFPDDNLANLQTFKRWKATSSANQNITFNIGSSVSADAIGIAAHNLGTITADILVQYWTGSAWATPGGTAVVSITSDKPYLGLFTSQAATQFRLVLTNMSAVPEIGVILLGDRLTMEKPIAAGWDPTAERTEITAQESKTGVLLQNEVRFREQNLQATIKRLTDTWYRANFLPAWNSHLHKGDPFFFSWDHSLFPGDTMFVRVADPSVNAPYDPVRRNLSLQLRGLVT